mmetsp:Transcript_36575/g.83863  ORF Transcript_36575/g.83863 Transcript_36575/m.83863 type:complete len:203 (+) Transcript_36575:105-713(+)
MGGGRGARFSRRGGCMFANGEKVGERVLFATGWTRRKEQAHARRLLGARDRAPRIGPRHAEQVVQQRGQVVQHPPLVFVAHVLECTHRVQGVATAGDDHAPQEAISRCVDATVFRADGARQVTSGQATERATVRAQPALRGVAAQLDIEASTGHRLPVQCSYARIEGSVPGSWHGDPGPASAWGGGCAMFAGDGCGGLRAGE